MATSIKISQLPAKGANLEATDLLEVSEFNGTGYVTKSITGQEIIDSASGGGGVTDVTASAPLASSGGTTPDISIPQADAGSDGYLTSTDYISFTNKQDALVSGTNIKTINGSSVLGSGDLTISGGSGLQGVHALNPLASGQSTYAATTSQGLASTSTTFNRVYAVPFIPAQNITTSALYMNVVAATGGQARILIYSSLNGLPDQKLYESTNLDCSTTGIKTAATTFNFVAGTTYFLCLQLGATFSVSYVNSSGAFPLSISGVGNPFTHVYITATIGSAPTTFGTPTFASGNTPFVGITKA